MDARKIHVIPNGANPDIFCPADVKECRKSLGLPIELKIVVFSGSLQIFYRVDEVIQAMPLILREFPTTLFVAVGRDYPPPFGLGRLEMRELAGKLGLNRQVMLLPPVDYSRVAIYINASDVCVLPIARLYQKGLGVSPLKMREYMSCGRPVVASDVPGDPRVLPKVGAGLLYEPGNPEDLASKVCTLLNDPIQARHMGENGRHYVLEKGTWRHVTQRIIAVAEEAMAERQRNEHEISRI